MKKSFLLFVLTAMLLSGASAERKELPYEFSPFSERALSGDVWDLGLNELINKAGRGFIQKNDAGFITEYVRGDAEHYILRNDSLIFRGYTRGRDVGTLVDSTPLALRFPLLPLDSALTEYSALGSIVGAPVFRDKGTLCSKVSAPGRFIFAPGDTVAAYLVHERRAFTTCIYDSVSLSGADDFWRWYLQGDCLPFALQFRRGGEAVPRLFLSDGFPGCDGVGGPAQEDEDPREQILNTAQISVSDTEATVILGGIADTEAEIYITDAAGNLYAHTVRPLDFPVNEFHISLCGIQRQNCMLVIKIGGNPPLTKVRLLQ